jgi:hypothetical protein
MIRALLLPLSLGAVMASIWLLPQSGTVAPSAIRLDLPDSLEPWQLRKIQPTEKEIKILAKDTDFSKAVCLAPIPGRYDNEGRPFAQRLDLSIVLSGADINNSIHRPERCMPAQGHQIYGSQRSAITTPAGHTLPARVLSSIQTLQAGDRTIPLHCLTYYFFVGHHAITSEHLKRTWIDMKDRVLRGQDQRWAYVSVSMWFDDQGEHGLPTREAAEKEIRRFLAELADRNIAWQEMGK